MIPESIRAEIEAKGGLLGAPEPQGNGTTIYRAASGDYVVVDDRTGQPRMRGFSPPADPATPPPAAAPAAPTQPAGAGGMNQQQLEELLRQVAPNNDPRRLVFSQGTKEKTVRESDPTAPGGVVTRTVKAPWVKWIDPGTGRKVEADVEGDGSYSITFNGTDDKEQGAAATKPPAEAAPGARPHEERDPSDPTRRRRWNPEANGGKGGWEDAGPDAEGARVAADRNKPATTIREDGRGGLVAIQTYPDGRAPTTTQIPGVQGKPDQLTHEGVVYERQADGTYRPAPGIPTPGAGLKNVEPFTPDYTQPDLGLGAWSAKQRGKIGLPPEQGGITQKDYDSAVTSAHASATTAITNITGATDVRRQAEQEERTQRKDLSSQAEADYTRASTELNSLLKSTTPTADEVGAIIPAIMAEQAKYRRAAEGTARPAPPLHPMFQWTGQAMGGPQSGVAWGAQPAAPPSAASPATPAPPPAPPSPPVGAGPMPAAPAAAGPPPAPAVSAPALTAPPLPEATPGGGPPAPAGAPGFTGGPATGAPTAGEPGGPPLAPGPVWMPPNPVEAAPFQDDQRQPAAPPYATPADMQPGVRIQVPGMAPGVSVPYPRDDPNSDGNTSMAPAAGPVSAWAGQALGANPAPAGGQPVLPDLQPATPAFDPFPAAGRLAQMGLSAEAIAIAMQELGMIPGREGTA